MPHQVHLRTLGRVSDHRLSMLRSLAVAVLRYERVKTTEAKAKEVRRIVDKIIGLGRDGTLAARRRSLALTRDQLIDQVSNGTPGGGNMPAYGKQLTAAEMDALAVFLVGLRPPGQPPARPSAGAQGGR